MSKSPLLGEVLEFRRHKLSAIVRNKQFWNAVVGKHVTETVDDGTRRHVGKMADFEVTGVIVDKDYVVLTLVFAEIRRYFLERAIRQLRVDEGLVTLRWLLLFAKLAVLDDLDDLLCDTRPPDVVGRSFSALGDAKVTIMDTVEDVFSQCRGYDDTTTFQEHTLADSQFVSRSK